MASSSSSPDATILSPSLTESQWVTQLSGNFAAEAALDISNIPVSVCNVPKSISSDKPDAYTPQVVALGPYHHLKPELYQMERFKLAAIKSFLKPDKVRDFQRLVIDKLKELNLTIRACYHKYLDLDDEALAWIVAVDGLFLLYLLSKYVNPSTPKDRRFAEDASLYRDVMMLENQIPAILLKEIRKALGLSSPNDEQDAELFSMMRNFCEAQSPFVLASKSQFTHDASSLHLLDLLSNLILSHQDFEPVPLPRKIPSWRDSTRVDIQPQVLIDNVEQIMNIQTSLLGGQVPRPVQLIKNIPWGMISNLVGLKPSNKQATGPGVQEVTVPTATHLSKFGGIKLNPTTGGIRDIRFDDSKAILYLPAVTLNANSEVIMRNLVAYEVATNAGATFDLAKFVDFLCGIIDTAEDVQLLKTQGIIESDLSSTEIVSIFNGMNTTSSKSFNEVTAQINHYFNKRPGVKVYRFAKKRVYASWKFLTLLSTVLLFLLLILQSFCQVYGCPRFFGRLTSS